MRREKKLPMRGWSALSLMAMIGMVATAAEQPAQVVVAVETRWTAPVTFTADPGTDRVATYEQMAEARVFYRPHRAVRIGVGVGIERGTYMQDLGADGQATDTPADTLPDHVRAAWLRLPAALMFSPHWGFTSLTSVGTATADGVAPAHDRHWTIEAGPVWVRNDDLLICLLVQCSTRIGRGPSIFPFPSVDWQIAPAWHLTVVDEIDGISRITWRTASTFSLGLRADVRFREYRVADEQSQALADDQLAAGCEATWYSTADDQAQLTAFSGASLIRRLTHVVEGDEVRREEAGAAFQCGLRLRCKF